MQNTLNILIADDDEGDRKQIRRALHHSSLSCNCTETRTVEEALEACEKSSFDCAIVDYRLPGEDGLQAISAMIARLPHIAIIMSTGQGDEMIAAEAMKRGASDYIPKSLISPEAIFRSVTNANEKVALRKKVAQQQEELQNFARVLAHDLKSPINSVRGFALAIEQEIRGGDPEEIAEYCQIVVRGLDRMAALIDALHGYASAERPVEFEDLDMGQLLSDTQKNLDHLIRQRGARVTWDELPAVSGHGPLLIQLLQNLVSNGIKYCEADPPCIHISASPREEGGWLFRVRDNGIGIPEKHCQEVFAPFKRLHGVGKYEGAGLGLATCKKIAERHDSGIWCESKVGSGTAFFFTLQGAHEQRV